MPGMGAFLAHEVHASYNAEEQIFMPPHRTLGFNPQVKVDDALLLSEYLNDTTLSYEDACNILEQDISKLRSRLSRKGIYRFGELGTFSMNINGEIAFEPGNNNIDDPKNFGFEPLAIPLLSECNKKDIVIKRRDFSRYIAVAAAIILAFIFVTPVSDNTYTPGMQASFTGITSGKKISTVMLDAPIALAKEATCEIAPVADTATENIITAKEKNHTIIEKIAVNTENIAPIEPSVKEVVAQHESVTATESDESVNKAIFHIIVASSPNAKNAQLAIEELSRKMDADYSIVEGERRFRISIESFSSEREAGSALSQIKHTFPDAWILKR